MKREKLIKALSNRIKEVERLNGCKTHWRDIRYVIKNGGYLQDIQNLGKWNYPAYFVMNFETFVYGKSLYDLLKEHGNGIENIVSLVPLKFENGYWF
jgi:hypothetical protein